MSNAIDDKELDEYLSGDTQYSQRYRSMSADDVPAELDRLVLKQASATNVTAIESAIGKRSPERARSLSFWMRVSAPIALAASVILVVSIVIESGVHYDSAPAAQEELKKAISPQQALPLEQAPASPEPMAKSKESDAEDLQARAFTEQYRGKMDAAAQSRRDQAPVKATTPALAPKLESIVEPSIVSTDEVTALGNLQASAPAIAAPVGRPASADTATADKRSEMQRSIGPTGLEEVIVTGQVRRQTANSGSGPHGTVPPANFEEHELSDAELAKQNREAVPTVWLAYIRELRANGKSSAADREWKRFVKAYPTYSVDEGDSARPRK